MRTSIAYANDVAAARSWTGRARTSFATDSALSRFFTSGTFRTRVSDLRIAAPGQPGAHHERRLSGRTLHG